ncbi:MAG: beta-hydroxyacyl-ACP dehydratase, partial [Candidatus Thiodiazotropha taylori]|nr:beta-hydroxyacyl-ACP dehydratase [Candidatus Thiodiazotropha taylori]MCW4257533.1 beta-hydroxyacyl-ACP dehydratase [Candidatus Thiodiazotropha taylori]
MAQPALNSPIHCSMLVHHPQQLAAWHRGAGISAAQFYQDVAKLAAQLPEAREVVNLCEDRYHFAVSFAAAIVRQQVTLMPSNNTPGAVNSLLNKSQDGYCLTDQLQQGIQAQQLLYTELL